MFTTNKNFESRASLCNNKAMGTPKIAQVESMSPWTFTMADRLSKALDVANVTGAQMAEYLGISQSRVGQIVNAWRFTRLVQLSQDRVTIEP